MSLAGRVRDLLARGALDLPPIGSGATPDRWRGLCQLARTDVSEARIAEAHVDAVQILAEAGRVPAPGCIYGVWASEGPRSTVNATPEGSETLVLHGVKAFCGGAGLVDRALVTATLVGSGSASSAVLVDLDLATAGPTRIDGSGWATPALADTSTATVDLEGLSTSRDAIVGAPGWYLDRPGFWHGAVGPAACWAGAALGLVDHLLAHAPADPHGRAHVGAVAARGWSLEAVLDCAGREVDAQPAAEHVGDPVGDPSEARARALAVRHIVDVGCAEIQDRFARALGPRPLVADRAVIERDRALSLYRRQGHAERDLAALGDLSCPP